MADSSTEGNRSPRVGEHTEEILIEELGYSAEEFAAIKNSGAITPSGKKETEAA
jgi:crotonobetainyl-CoA:carnitine CoA-transferase CaiB-like acyl-CoA transferase